MYVYIIILNTNYEIRWYVEEVGTRKELQHFLYSFEWWNIHDSSFSTKTTIHNEFITFIEVVFELLIYSEIGK